VNRAARTWWWAWLAATGVASQAASAVGADPDLKALPVNHWVQVADGPVNPYANPVYDGGSQQLVAVLSGGNGTAHFNPQTGRWDMALPPTKAPRGGDQPLMKDYALRDGRPNYGNMLLFHMTAYDSLRGRIFACAAGFMACYDPKTSRWTDEEAVVELYGRKYPGAPPVAWGSMCYDPVHDELVLLPGGAVFNFDRWETDREVTGHFGTWLYSARARTWTRPAIGPSEFYRARAMLCPVRIALQAAMSDAGEVMIRQRNGETDAAGVLLEDVRRRTAQLRSRMAAVADDVRKLDGHPRLAAAADRIQAGTSGLSSDGTAEEIYCRQFAALSHLLVAHDHQLWSHPHPRMLSRMVYLPEQEAILLFGGTDGYQELNDTWLYDCRKREWTKRTPQRMPSARQGHVLVYHPRLKRAVMAGGFRHGAWDSTDLRRDVWIYDPAADQWQLVLEEFPAKPGCRSYYGEYDPRLDAVVLLRDGRETFLLRLQPERTIEPPPAELYPQPEDRRPFLPPADEPEVLARWKSLPANTWVAADPPCEPGEHGWGMMGYNGRMHAAMMWGGGHSTHQANEISLYFPGANRWVVAYPPHRIDIAPWNKACGNPGGVDVRGGVHNLHARNGLAGNGTRSLISIQCFSPYWYGPEAMLRQPLRWGRTTLFEFDYFSRRCRMPLPSTPATGMCYPYNEKNTVLAADEHGARWFDLAKDDWQTIPASGKSKKVFGGGGEGTGPGYLLVEKKRLVLAVGPDAEDPKGPIETWAFDFATGAWRDLKPRGVPPGRPVGLAYCETDDVVFAACFTGWSEKTPHGQEAVYSFAKNAWSLHLTRIRSRTGSSATREGPRAYGAWAKLVYSPRYNLLLNFQEQGGMWVMRPELAGQAVD